MQRGTSFDKAYAIDSKERWRAKEGKRQRQVDSSAEEEVRCLPHSFTNSLTTLELTAGLGKESLHKLNLSPFSNEIELGKSDFRERSWGTEAITPAQNHSCFSSHKSLFSFNIHDSMMSPRLHC